MDSAVSRGYEGKMACDDFGESVRGGWTADATVESARTRSLDSAERAFSFAGARVCL